MMGGKMQKIGGQGEAPEQFGDALIVAAEQTQPEQQVEWTEMEHGKCEKREAQMTQMGEEHLALQAFQLLCSLLGMAQIGLLLAQIVGGNARQVDERHALAHIERAVDMAAEIIENR